MRRFWKKLSSFVWWNYPRATVEYDIMVGLILTFIFLTPRQIFRDQPRPFTVHKATVTMVTADGGHFFEILGAAPNANVPELIQKYVGHPVKIRSIQTIRDQSSSALIYNVWTQP
jgi:hypothetical protein